MDENIHTLKKKKGGLRVGIGLKKMRNLVNTIMYTIMYIENILNLMAFVCVICIFSTVCFRRQKLLTEGRGGEGAWDD